MHVAFDCFGAFSVLGSGIFIQFGIVSRSKNCFCRNQSQQKMPVKEEKMRVDNGVEKRFAVEPFQHGAFPWRPSMQLHFAGCALSVVSGRAQIWA